MDTLRDTIQKLTRSVNPLGKLMDFLQEDIDSMQMELSMWRNIYTSTKTDLKRETGLVHFMIYSAFKYIIGKTCYFLCRLTQTAVQPLKLQLAQIEANIKEHIELINMSRLNILQNEEKIYKLLSEI